MAEQTNADEKITVWMRGNRELVKEFKKISLEDGIPLMDIITKCLVSCYSDRIPERLHVFAAYSDRKNDQSEA